jgi:hypothetical protein
VYCVKNPFTLIVIPGLTKPAPYLIRGGNDGFGAYVKKCWTHYNRGGRDEKGYWGREGQEELNAEVGRLNMFITE